MVPTDSEGRENPGNAIPPGTLGDLSDAGLLTIAEVASLMRVSKMTVYRQVHAGELRAVRVGRSFRVSKADLDDYLKQRFYDAG